MVTTEPRNRYGGLCAEIYDLDKPVGSLFDVAYYTGQLSGLAGPVLEAACGTGRLTVPLLRAGIDMWGFDHSLDMLAMAAANAAAAGVALPLQHARFQDFTYDTSFAAIVVPASSFILIDDIDEAMAVLRRFRRHLAPGGRLLIDLPPISFLDAPGGARTWTAANGDLLRLESQSALIDPLRQRRVNHDRYERWRDGQLVESQIELFAYRVWGMLELELALAAQGFAEITVWGDYRDAAPPRAGARTLNFSARAP